MVARTGIESKSLRINVFGNIQFRRVNTGQTRLPRSRAGKWTTGVKPNLSEAPASCFCHAFHAETADLPARGWKIRRPGVGDGQRCLDRPHAPDGGEVRRTSERTRDRERRCDAISSHASSVPVRQGPRLFRVSDPVAGQKAHLPDDHRPVAQVGGRVLHFVPDRSTFTRRFGIVDKIPRRLVPQAIRHPNLCPPSGRTLPLVRQEHFGLCLPKPAGWRSA
jgi:hypothetical protein